MARVKERAAQAAREGREKAGKAVATERIVECAHCGLNVPESEALQESGRFYCCDAHRLSGPRAG